MARHAMLTAHWVRTLPAVVLQGGESTDQGERKEKKKRGGRDEAAGDSDDQERKKKKTKKKKDKKEKQKCASEDALRIEVGAVRQRFSSKEWSSERQREATEIKVEKEKEKEKKEKKKAFFFCGECVVSGFTCLPCHADEILSAHVPNTVTLQQPPVV